MSGRPVNYSAQKPFPKRYFRIAAPRTQKISPPPPCPQPQSKAQRAAESGGITREMIYAD